MRFARPLVAAALVLAPTAVLAAPDTGLPGKLIFETRLRSETVQQDGKAHDAQALTVRTRLGWQSPTLAGFSFLAEGVNVTALKDDYADTITPKPGYPAIGDPELTQLNRLQVDYRRPGFEATVGRQRLILGNARFIGNSGWRQNEQTFDAVKLVATPFKPLTLTYVYADKVHRTGGPDHPLGEFKGDIQLFQADLATPAGTVTAYDYRLDFDNVPGQSSQTWGLRLAGAQPAGGVKLTYELEYARQSDFGRNPASFDLDYRLASFGVKAKASALALYYERLEGDGLHGFQTPLASAHPFQGWSDVIVTTPGFGVRDIFLRGSTSLDKAIAGKTVKLTAEAHDFRDSGDRFGLGREFDLAASVPLTKQLTVEAKAAAFDGSRPGFADTTKVWFTLEYRY
jgi:hypothetical protein